MKHANFKDVLLEEMNVEGAKGAKIRWLVGEKDGSTNFAKRMFEIEVGGNTPYHTHNFEHVIFILEGEGKVVIENGELPMNHWDAIFIEPNAWHQFVNIGDKPLIFLCSIPLEEKKVAKPNPFMAGKANNC